MGDPAEDLARVQAVTDVLAGPAKVWVLTIHYDGITYVYVHHTRNGAIDAARHDMETGFKDPPAKELIDAAIDDLSRNNQVSLHDADYALDHQEIGE